ncbi:MAG: ribonuclease P protein component [Candidatus Taylorbacteria bacterium RIFCSPHIGHO2_01_FULL_45_63]|uniref:Ribonuclease P protein component n=1 Tax=Candidatus Taylorbacteria bacterium RIFCSPHIGHO2_02_FULL_45_35 TaxID=1802311 RepID=A0A1G2MTI5_9BACT|nr:MAG: ribonuclease P protein component [Candidatus Taylorbacteria bacterium RIFCSPHIGHO2_01_FULL_45_63]OHA27153.1 MAG: ribonuclease P protein component [Candidatus Taylorbacteria bacterium RIFCSPHIGHO2_02_FULL_45_35]OHA33853.1 MAG: ribonuclease P protein component [Candidatus Taylorbacteria bacterium RIFCSPLOWO2_01_FULL_45_34b]
MLPRRQRISRALFQELLKKGVSFHAGNLSLRVLKKDAREPHFAFVVPNNVSKKAVARNRLRRRGYSIVEKYLPLLKTQNVSMAFFCKKGLEKKTFNDFRSEINALLKKTSLL